MTLVALVSLVESPGVYFALGDITEKKIKGDDLKHGYRAEGMAIILCGLVNAFPYTTFSQNVGLIQISCVRRNKIIYIAGAMLTILGLTPNIVEATLAISVPVLSDAMLVMFGMVISVVIKMLSHVDLNKQEDMVFVAISLGMGLAV